jgi:beta-glucosidase
MPVCLASLLLVTAVLVALLLGAAMLLSHRHPELRWDASKFPKDLPRFPKSFLWGVAAAAHQVEGGNDNNNWSAWEKARDERGRPRIREGQVAGLACDHWNRFREDIALMKDLGVGAYRFSVEWSRLEPQRGAWDEAAARRYHEILDALDEAGIKPMITLHHFTDPLWFVEAGGFEKRENLPIFVGFCERVFKEYGPRVELWCTLNEPEVYAVQGWFTGLFPPGRKDAALAIRVLGNLLAAHVQVYHRLKALPGGERARIGIVKDIFQFTPLRTWFLPEWILADLFDKVFNRIVLDTFKTDRFTARIPFVVSIDEPCEGASRSNDFVGLNYYSHFRVKLQLSTREPITFGGRPADLMTDMPYPLYPEGFYLALRQIAELGAPVMVTENGVPDEKDSFRDRFIRSYLHALRRAMDDGVDVRGYFYWSLMDNFEWCEGWSQKFGLYAMDPATRERRFREGSEAFREVLRNTER